MGELINLRRVKKVAQRAAKEQDAAANRLVHGAPTHLRKMAKAEKRRATRKVEAHKLNEEPSS